MQLTATKLVTIIPTVVLSIALEFNGNALTTTDAFELIILYRKL